jgi:hypothetical protein
MITKIISGAQTGADQGGLEAGRILKLETGGVAPKGFRTETGSNPTLKDYGIIEHESPSYPPRTIENVRNSTGTVWFGNESSPGGKLTIKTCKKFGKPYTINPSKLTLIKWINWNNIRTLNVAGNRESTNKGLQEKVKNFLVMVLTSEEYLGKKDKL